MRELWKTRCICQEGGSCSCELVGVVLRILKGPSHRGASLALGCVVLTLVPSSHMSCPMVNVWEGAEGPLVFIISAAIFRAAVTSERIWSRNCRYSSTEGDLDAKFVGGRNSG